MTAKEFITGLPERVNPDALEGLETVFHFNISGDDGGQYTVSLKDQQLKVEEGLLGEARCTVTTSDENFMGIIRGTLNPMMAVFSGKLKTSNPGELLKYSKIFGIM
jgi:putative sterol carrier protein